MGGGEKFKCILFTALSGSGPPCVVSPSTHHLGGDYTHGAKHQRTGSVFVEDNVKLSVLWNHSLEEKMTGRQTRLTGGYRRAWKVRWSNRAFFELQAAAGS